MDRIVEDEEVAAARALVLAAFRPRGLSLPSPTGDFSGAKPARRHRGRGSSGRLSEERRERRAAGADRIETGSQAPAKFSRPLLHPDQRITGSIIGAVYALETSASLLIRARYRPPGLTQRQDLEQFCRRYFARYQRAGHLWGCREDTRAGVRGLIEAAVRFDFDVDRAAAYLGIDTRSKSWGKTYRRHWIQISAEINTLDRSALLEVLRRIRAPRERDEVSG